MTYRPVSVTDVNLVLSGGKTLRQQSWLNYRNTGFLLQSNLPGICTCSDQMTSSYGKSCFAFCVDLMKMSGIAFFQAGLKLV